LIEFRVLGPVEAVAEGRPVPLPAAKPRALLARLLLSRNRVVSVAELVDDLWGEDPPETATKALQGYVSQLRKSIGADRVLTKPPGYSLRVDEGELDLDRFEELVREGRERLRAGDAKAAAERFERALELWRGRPFAEFDAEPFARDAAARLEDSRLAALEGRIEADLTLGRHAEVVPELEELVAREPYRERPRGQLMLALYRSGRQTEALDVYRRTRETLVDELGIEPGQELQDLERAILQHDKRLEMGRPSPKAEAVAAPPRRRSSLVAVAVAVTVLAVAGATAFALTRGGSSENHPPTADRAMQAFVSKLERFLAQSREGRRDVSAAVDAASHCRLPSRAAVVDLDRVQRNRQSVLQQLSALSIPGRDEALRASDLLQQAVQASISADSHYRDWLVRRHGCAAPVRGRDLSAAQAADIQATRAKRAFVHAFNPLARRFGKRAWRAREF
jgi:DNA-binding SARP family transcriptional activator